MEPGVKRLLVWCADRPGIVAAVSAFLFDSGANIVTSDQHTSDPEGGQFFLRMEFTLPAGGEPLGGPSGRLAPGGRRAAGGSVGALRRGGGGPLRDGLPLLGRERAQARGGARVALRPLP